MDLVDFIIDYEEFKVRYIEAANNLESVGGFWNTYNPNLFTLLSNRQYLKLRDRLFGLLRTCKRIDPEAFRNIHKGHPYYFIGISSFLLDDYLTALYFFDAAVSEDLKYPNLRLADPSTWTPAVRFLMLDIQSNQQAAEILTQLTYEKVRRLLSFYNGMKDPAILPLTMGDFQKRFLHVSLEKYKNASHPGYRSLVTTLLTYCLEWDFRNEHFEYEVKEGTSEPFFLHLFRGCLLFESLVKLNTTQPPQNNTLGKILGESYIKNALKFNGNLNKFNKHKQRGSFDLADVKGGVQQVQDVSDAIIIAYMARNTLGHSLGWQAIIDQTQYRQLFEVIGAACFHVINCLW